MKAKKHPSLKEFLNGNPSYIKPCGNDAVKEAVISELKQVGTNAEIGLSYQLTEAYTVHALINKETETAHIAILPGVSNACSVIYPEEDSNYKVLPEEVSLKELPLAILARALEINDLGVSIEELKEVLRIPDVDVSM